MLLAFTKLSVLARKTFSKTFKNCSNSEIGLSLIRLVFAPLSFIFCIIKMNHNVRNFLLYILFLEYKSASVI